MRASRPLALLAVSITTTALLTACGQAAESKSDDTSTSPAPATSAPKQGVTTPAPEPTSGFENSIIVTSCEGELGEIIVVTGYDPQTGEQLARTAFEKPPLSNGESIGSRADCFATQNLREDRRMEGVFNADFTQVYGTWHKADGTSTIGAIGEDGKFTEIIAATADEFTAQDVKYPALHAASGRLFYWDGPLGETKLYSVKPDGSDIRPEPDIQAKFHPSRVGEQFALPDTKEPAPLTFTSDDSAYNKAGTLVAYDDQGYLEINKPPLGSDTIGVEIPDSDAGSCDAIALLDDDKTVVCKDRNQIFTLELQGGTVKVTTLFDNTGELQISSAKVSRDGAQVTFVGELAGVSALYTIPMSGGKPKKIVADVGALPVLLDYRK